MSWQAFKIFLELLLYLFNWVYSFSRPRICSCTLLSRLVTSKVEPRLNVLLSVTIAFGTTKLIARAIHQGAQFIQTKVRETFTGQSQLHGSAM